MEAYTESSDNQRYGETYANWSEEWFASDRSNKYYYIAYQNEYWELSFFASDCGISGGVFFQIGGILGSILAIVGVWRVSNTSR